MKLAFGGCRHKESSTDNYGFDWQASHHSFAGSNLLAYGTSKEKVSKRVTEAWTLYFGKLNMEPKDTEVWKLEDDSPFHLGEF